MHCSFTWRYWLGCLMLLKSGYVRLWCCCFKVVVRGFGPFGANKEGRIFWRRVLFAVVWSTRWEHNKRIFKNQSLLEALVWERVVLLLIVGLYARRVCPSGPVSDVQRDWKAYVLILCTTKDISSSFCILIFFSFTNNFFFLLLSKNELQKQKRICFLCYKSISPYLCLPTSWYPVEHQLIDGESTIYGMIRAPFR